MDIKELRKIGLEVRFFNPLGIFTLDDFSYLSQDLELKRIADNSSLYLILQRPCILFRKLELNKDFIKGEVHQPHLGKFIRFKLPLYQKDVVEGEKRDLNFHICYNKYVDAKQEALEQLEDIVNIESLSISEVDENGGGHIKLLTPDTILERHYNEAWEIEIVGDIQCLLRFEVVYVGHSVKQYIGNRIKNHSNIQRILTRRRPFQKGMHVAKELCICLLQIKDIYDARVISNLSKGEALNFMRGGATPKEEFIYYDAEKALINFFENPRLENQDKYKNYPKSRDGLFEKEFPVVIYSIDDEITLLTQEQTLKCGKTEFDSILVNRNEKSILKLT